MILDHEVPLNKRFVTRFKGIMEGKGFVVAKTLPHDNVTVFGKIQLFIKAMVNTWKERGLLMLSFAQTKNMSGR